MSTWTIEKAGSFQLIRHPDSDRVIAQLECTNAEARLIVNAPEMHDALELALVHMAHAKHQAAKRGDYTLEVEYGKTCALITEVLEKVTGFK